ncbi:MAG TPA: PRC-barrel domain-containing protein [Stellaceae bacterium]|nr:PRC-barrel domain-containing protein [Stellaceae bacterium]
MTNLVTKLAIPAAIAATMALTGPGAFAQNVPQATRPMTASPAALTVQPNQVRASKYIGSTVYDLHNRDIGSVKDLVLDQSGRVGEVVVDVGTFLGMGGKYVAVSMADIKTDNNRLTLDRTKEQLQAAQAFQLEPSKSVDK